LNSIALIPAFKPDQRLVQLVEQLSITSVSQTVIVNDGSPAEFEPIFTAVAKIPHVTVLNHLTNQGKGAALRTGFRFIEKLSSDESWVITADADGQHSVKDILQVAAAAETQPESIIIGGRRFDKDVPPRSLFGNTVTRWVLRLFFGIKLWDTQTGLRAIPRRLLPELIEIPYDHYELELEMLMVARRRHVPLVEIPIETIYIENNRSSHFKPLLDSTRVYLVMFRDVLSSLVTIGADYLVFILAYSLSQNIPLIMLMARIVSVIVNYILLKMPVFYSKAKMHHTFPRFVLLAAICGVITTIFILTLTHWTTLTPLPAKLISEIGLYFIIFSVIKGIVLFKPNPPLSI
jgi:glycosyltransferase involved in cell wall biosynthesis